MKKRTASLLGAAVLSAMPVVSLAAATPAVAAPTCNKDSQKREFSTPGYDTNITIKVCVVSSIANDGTPIFRAHTILTWQDGGGTRKFDNFDVGVRLEGLNGRNLRTNRCDYTSEINATEADGGKICYTAWGYGGTDFITGDATVYYNLDRDGEGGMKWQLRGTPHL